MNCDCTTTINNKLKEAHNVELDRRMFAFSVVGGKMFYAMFLPTVQVTDGKKTRKCPPVRISFCPFCGKDASPPEEKN